MLTDALCFSCCLVCWRDTRVSLRLKIYSYMLVNCAAPTRAPGSAVNEDTLQQRPLSKQRNKTKAIREHQIFQDN